MYQKPCTPKIQIPEYHEESECTQDTEYQIYATNSIKKMIQIIGMIAAAIVLKNATKILIDNEPLHIKNQANEQKAQLQYSEKYEYVQKRAVSTMSASIFHQIR